MSDQTQLRQPLSREPAEAMKPIVDPAGWTGEELARDKSWEYVVSDGEAAEFDRAVDSVRSRGLDIKDITPDDFPLPSLEEKLAAMKAQIMDGRGIAVLRGLDIDRYGIAGAAAAFWGVGLRLGLPVSQNYKGHLLGHVRDIVGPSREKPNVRAYHSSAELGYHSDSSDVLGLMCLQKAKSGGASRIVSTVALYNEMLRRRPDLVAELVKPWYRDRREEIPPGKKPWFELPVFGFAEGYFSCFWANYYIRSAQRFSELPRFTPAQTEALDMMDTIADEIYFDNEFTRGGMVFLHNHVTAHARTAYEDWPEPERMRHLLRLWLATPGGRPLPEAVLERYVGLKPGQRPAGVIVEGMSFHTPLEPE